MASVIVVGVNASRESEQALATAAALAARTDHSLTVVYVAHLPATAAVDPVGAGAMIASLDEVVDQCHVLCELTLAGVEVAWTFEVRQGYPVGALIDAAHERQADCIVVGRGEHRRFPSRLGSVASRLVQRAHRPVLVVPASAA